MSANSRNEPRASPTDDEVLSPATPGAEALPLPDDAVEKPSEESESR